MMSPIPVNNKDDPDKDTQDEIEDIETPQFIVTGSDSEEDADEMQDQGYQLLPQEPEEEGEEMNFSEPVVATSGAVSMDEAIMSSIDQQDFTQSQYLQGLPLPKTETDERLELWSEPQKAEPQPLSAEKADEIKAVMSGFTLPSTSLPDWAKSVSDDDWKDNLLERLQKPSQSNSRQQHRHSHNDDGKR